MLSRVSMRSSGFSESERDVKLKAEKELRFWTNRPKQVKQLICFTSDRSQPFLAALSKYPVASTVSI